MIKLQAGHSAKLQRRVPCFAAYPPTLLCVTDRNRPQSFLAMPWQVDGGRILAGLPRGSLPFRIKARPGFLFIKLLYYIIASVPATMSASPISALADNFSLKTKYENAIVTRMLNLSMGTTTEAWPACKALK